MDLLWKHIKGETDQSSGGKAKINGTFFARAQNTGVFEPLGLSNANVSTDSIFYTHQPQKANQTFPPSICTWTIGEACLRLVPLSLLSPRQTQSLSADCYSRLTSQGESVDGFQCVDDSHL